MTRERSAAKNLPNQTGCPNSVYLLPKRASRGIMLKTQNYTLRYTTVEADRYVSWSPPCSLTRDATQPPRRCSWLYLVTPRKRASRPHFEPRLDDPWSSFLSLPRLQNGPVALTDRAAEGSQPSNSLQHPQRTLSDRPVATQNTQKHTVHT